MRYRGQRRDGQRRIVLPVDRECSFPPILVSFALPTQRMPFLHWRVGEEAFAGPGDSEGAQFALCLRRCVPLSRHASCSPLQLLAMSLKSNLVVPLSRIKQMYARAFLPLISLRLT